MEFALDSLGSTKAGAGGRRFYVIMAGVFMLIAFGGFFPTYWHKLATGTFGGAPVLHIHGAFFFTWTLFFFMQTSLVALGRTPDHRAWGMAGIALATGMAFTGVLGTINLMQVAAGIGMLDEGRRFAIVPLVSLAFFVVFFAVAIVKVKEPEVHKRLMFIAMIPLMQAAVGRIFRTLFAPPGTVGPAPVFVTVPPGLVVDLLIVAAMVYDWRTRGRVHPVYLVCGPLLLANQILAVPLSATSAWMAIATWVHGLAG